MSRSAHKLMRRYCESIRTKMTPQAKRSYYALSWRDRTKLNRYLRHVIRSVASRSGR